MNQPTDDDRPFRAEDLLEAVIVTHGSSARADTSMSERIAQFLESVPEPGLTLDGSHSPRPPVVETTPADSLSVPVAPPVRVPNHTLIRCIGSGGFGQVWVAQHELTHHYRACKLIDKNCALELDGLRRLKQRVPSHPNLFPIEEVGAVGDWLYCLMPLADPATSDHAVLDSSGYAPLTLLTHLRRHGRRPTSEIASIGADLAAGLEHLHTHDVTHGDVKPANIMRLGGRWALADYGLVRDLAAPTCEAHTPAYTPPEGPGSAAADQFALGAVLLELLTGLNRVQESGVRKESITQRALNEAGHQLAAIIRKATAPEPVDRFGSIGELAAALRRLATDKTRSRQRGVLIAVALMPVLGAALGAFLLPFPSPTQPSGESATIGRPDALIKSFEVRHYRYDPAADTTYAIGALGADNLEVRVDDDVTIHAGFSEPAYFYLVSLDTDGRVRPRLPASPTERPVAANAIDYPSLPTNSAGDVLYNLSSGPGTQGFMLLAAESPLPSWSDWIATRGEPKWSRESLPATGVILFDGSETRYASTTREPMPRRGALVLDPVDWARAQRELSDVRFIAFPVLQDQDQ